MSNIGWLDDDDALHTAWVRASLEQRYIEASKRWRHVATARPIRSIDDVFVSEEVKPTQMTQAYIRMTKSRYLWYDAAPLLDPSRAVLVSDADVLSRLIDRRDGDEWGRIEKERGLPSGWVPAEIERHLGLDEDPAGPFLGNGREPTVRISALLKKGAILATVVCVASIVYWLLTGVVILNPFLAMLLIIGLPFIYLMGIYAERESRKQ